jgi:hypothetical protein
VACLLTRASELETWNSKHQKMASLSNTTSVKLKRQSKIIEMSSKEVVEILENHPTPSGIARGVKKQLYLNHLLYLKYMTMNARHSWI